MALKIFSHIETSPGSSSSTAPSAAHAAGFSLPDKLWTKFAQWLWITSALQTGITGLWPANTFWRVRICCITELWWCCQGGMCCALLHCWLHPEGSGRWCPSLRMSTAPNISPVGCKGKVWCHHEGPAPELCFSASFIVQGAGLCRLSFDFLGTASPKPLCRPAPAGFAAGGLCSHETSVFFCSSSPQSYLTCPATCKCWIHQGFLHGLLGGSSRDSAISLCFKCVFSWITFSSSALMIENLGTAFPTP